MNKVCFIIPFFGPSKWWHTYFFKSIATNNNYLWLIIADQINDKSIPANARLVSMSLQEFNQFVSSKIKISTNIIHPFKICDFKPAFGQIFSDYLKDYDYWAYCDMDIIMGDLDSFLANVLHSGYDVISPDNVFFPGHFLILKNCKKMNMLYTKAVNHIPVFTSEKCYFFDEFVYSQGLKLTNGSIKKFSSRKILLHKIRMRIADFFIIKWLSQHIKSRWIRKKYIKVKLYDYNALLRFFEERNEIRIYRKLIYDSDVTRIRKGQKKWKVRWQNGKLYNEDHEILYFHFQHSKFKDTLEIVESIEEYDYFELKNK